MVAQMNNRKPYNRILTQQQINFVHDVLSEIKPGRAYMNHYKPKSMAVADACASALLKTPKIAAYMQKLRDKIEDETIAKPQERQRILSEIARGNLLDYQDADGLKVSKGSPNTRAISEITTRTRMMRKEPVSITNVKLHSPIQAIDLLNKMDRLYSEGGTVNVDNRQVNIYVMDEETKTLMGQVADRTGKLVIGSNKCH